MTSKHNELIGERITELLRKRKRAENGVRPDDVKDIDLLIKINLKFLGLKEKDHDKYLNERMPD